MPFPSGTYINQILDAATRAELEQFYSLLQGYLSAQHNDDGSHGDITTGDIDATGDITASGDGIFSGDVTANKDASSSVGPFESGLVGSHSNASVLGPALQLGRTVDTWRWFLAANVLRGSPAGAVAALEFIAGKDSASFRRVMQLTQADTPVSGEYYIAPSVTGKLYLGAASGVLGAFSQAANIEAIYTKLGIFERNRTVAMGEWTSVAFNAANFTSVGGGTAWTVIAANQVTYAYTVIGKTLIVVFSITGTNVTGTPTELGIAIPGGFTVAKTALVPFRVFDAGTGKFGIAEADAGTTKIRLFTSVGGAGWAATAGSDTYAQGTITLEVQ